MTTYTVVGLTDDNGELYVAGVIEGVHSMVDNESESGGMWRWADSFEANHWSEAEEMAHAQIAEANQ